MNARAGVVTSQVVWLISLPVTASAPSTELSVKGAAAGFLVAALASFMPDLDHHNSTAGRYMPGWFDTAMGGHRMLTHSLLAIGFSWWLTGYLIGNPIVANAVAVGWGTHVFLDMLTVQGVGLLYPLVSTKIRLGWMVTGSRSEDWFVTGVQCVGVVVAIGYAAIALTGGP